MAISGSRSWSSRENEYRNLKQITQHRLLHEMLASVKQTELMKILVVDEVTLRIMGSTFKMSDIVNDEVGVYLIENLHMKREPLGADAIYFIQPSRESYLLSLAALPYFSFLLNVKFKILSTSRLV
ncbi:hypothetical protein GIB67_021525 [Kingdonia uniflora]|uniref:Uncharacterized protein n=1 Tax=Kingdonia uniflora TaxID=39325 RepID=A0A7J7L9K3_9MAGN|nr:hypothetical protein GIB67_021525 [Kingdonia uniflora]